MAQGFPPEEPKQAVTTPQTLDCEKLERERQFLESIIDNASAAIAVTKGPDHIFELVNPLYQTFKPGVQMIGRPAAEVFPELKEQGLIDIMDRVYQTAEPHRATDFRVFLRCNGTKVKEICWNFCFTPRKDEAERVQGILQFIVETTEEARAREAAQAVLREAQEQARRGEADQRNLRAIVDAIPVAVTVAEMPSGQIALINRAAIDLFGPPMTSEMTLDDYFKTYRLYLPSGEALVPQERPLRRTLEHGDTITGMEVVLKRIGREPVHLLVNSAPLRNTIGQITGAIIVYQDISKLKELDQIRAEFISVASHQLRTPLTSIKAIAQTLKKKAVARGVDQLDLRSLDTINSEVDRMIRLIQAVLDMSKAQAGEVELARKPMDLVESIRQVVEDRQATTTKHTIRLQAEVPQLIGNWDKDRVEQVMWNLLENAIRFSPRGGPIDVVVRRLDGEAEVAITDQGVGIADEVKRHLFGRPFMGYNTVRHRPMGLGLGLYLSNQIVALHGGRIWVESEVGYGSTFFFTLPLGR
ncbi:MAG: ATP-binding protein [Chloroflexi bacterium]|nr:ATP-binding protein [Chloroflexota bacterium]